MKLKYIWNNINSSHIYTAIEYKQFLPLFLSIIIVHICECVGVDLSSAKLSSAKLIYANLRGANLSNANLSDANLSDAWLRGAIYDSDTEDNLLVPDFNR